MHMHSANTILYCQQWERTVAFYRDVFAFPITHQTEWFVEFQVAASAFLSIADERRATIHSSGGDGITLAWQVAELHTTHERLTHQGIEITPIQQKWGSYVCYLYDPEGHRIELWQPLSS